MRELLDEIYDILANDQTLLTLINGSEQDKRIYVYHPNLDIVINSDYPAYVTYHCVSYSNKDKKSENEVPDEIYILNIWGLKRSLLMDVFNRIDELLNEDVIETENYKVLRCVRDYKSDQFDNRWNLPGLEVKYRFCHILKKSDLTYKFKIGSTEVVINHCESTPKEFLYSKNVKYIETTGGLIYATKVGEDKKFRKIKLNFITQALRDDLLNFYKNVCKGILMTIEFTDSDNEVYYVKWIDEEFKFYSPLKNYWSGEINLRILSD